MNIPLSEIPNSPVSATPALEQARGDGDTTYRQIRTSIDEGGNALKQNLSQVAQPGLEAAKSGEYLARSGNTISQAGLDISKFGAQVGEGLSTADNLIKSNALATYQTNATQAKSAFDAGLDKSKPETWTAQYQDFIKSNGDTFTQGLSPLQKAIIGPDLVRQEASDMANLGAKAHIQYLQNSKESGTNAMTDAINGGRYHDATTQLDALSAAGVIGAEERNHWQNTITGAHQKQSITNLINANPTYAITQLQDAIDNNKQVTVPDENGKPTLATKVTVGELEAYKNTAIQVKDYQVGKNYNSFSNSIDNDQQRPPSLAALQSDPRFQFLDKDQQQKLSDQYLNKAVLTDPATVSHYNQTRAAVLGFNPDPNDQSSRPFQQENQLRQAISETPKAQRQELNKILDGTMKDWLSPDKSTPGTASREAVVPNMVKGEIAKFYEQNTSDPYQAKQKADDALFAFDKAWADPKQKGSGSLDDARQILNKITNPDNRGIGADKILQSQPTPSAGRRAWDWITGKAPQASNDSTQPLGKVTSYGYKNDETPDSLTKAGKSAIGKLSPSSLAVSPDVESKLTQSGIQIGDKVQLHLADGSSVVRTWDDRTAKQYKGKSLTGRFDFYSPNVKADQEGTHVVGFSKV